MEPKVITIVCSFCGQYFKPNERNEIEHHDNMRRYCSAVCKRDYYSNEMAQYVLPLRFQKGVRNEDTS